MRQKTRFWTKLVTHALLIGYTTVILIGCVWKVLA